MNKNKYFKYSMYVLMFLCFLATGCATSPQEVTPQPPASTSLNSLSGEPEAPEGLKDLFITQSEDAEKMGSHSKKPDQLLSFSLNNANIQETLLALSKESGHNIIVDPDVGGTVTVDLKKVTVKEALDSLLIPLGLKYEERGKFVRVSRPKMQTRIFTLDYIITKRKGKGELTVSGGVSETSGDRGSSGSGSSSSSSGSGEDDEEKSKSSLETESEIDLWVDIQNGLETIIFADTASSEEEEYRTGGSWSKADEEGRRLIGNPHSGIIMITSYPREMARAAEFLEAVEGSVQRQVLIHAKIMEIRLEDGYEMGIDWGYVTNSSNVTGTLTPWSPPADVDFPAILQNLTPGLGVFQVGLANEYFNLLIDAMAKEGQVDMLSSPKLCTLNNQKSIIKVGREEVFFEISTETQFVDGGSRVIESTETRTVTIGVILDVTPSISSDGFITMSIHPSVSELAGEAKSRLGDTAPIVDVREVDTVIRVKEGETIILGGLIKDKVKEEIRSVPFLGDIPYIGSLFRHTRQNKEKTELVITLTPTVMIGKKINALAQQQMESFGDRGTAFHFGGRPWGYGTEGEYTFKRDVTNIHK